jgi:hypothetical protein
MNFELLRQICRDYLRAESPHVTEEHIYAFTMLLHPRISQFVIAELDKAFRSPDFVRHYHELISISPIEPHTLDSSNLLQIISSPVDSLILLSPNSRLEDKFWGAENDALDRDFVWPLGVNSEAVVRVPGRVRFRRTKADVVNWSVAAAHVSHNHIPFITKGILEDQIPVLAVVVDDNGVVVLFHIGAANYKQWAARCTEIRTYLRSLGIYDLCFHIETLIPLEQGSREQGKIIYFA